MTDNPLVDFLSAVRSNPPCSTIATGLTTHQKDVEIERKEGERDCNGWVRKGNGSIFG